MSESSDESRELADASGERGVEAADGVTRRLSRLVDAGQGRWSLPADLTDADRQRARELLPAYRRQAERYPKPGRVVQWLGEIGQLICPGRMRGEEAMHSVQATAKELAKRYPAGCFTEAARESVTWSCQWWPTPAELAEHLDRAWLELSRKIARLEAMALGLEVETVMALRRYRGPRSFWSVDHAKPRPEDPDSDIPLAALRELRPDLTDEREAAEARRGERLDPQRLDTALAELRRTPEPMPEPDPEPEGLDQAKAELQAAAARRREGAPAERDQERQN